MNLEEEKKRRDDCLEKKKGCAKREPNPHTGVRERMRVGEAPLKQAAPATKQ